MQKPSAESPVHGIEWGSEAKIYLEELLLNAHVIPCGRGNKGRKKEKRPTYIDVLSAFDIETTSLPDIKQAFMYIWQWHFVSLDNDESLTIYGRYWDQWQDCVRLICETLRPGWYLVVLDHNLSFEFQYLCEYYPFSPDEVFATDARAVVKCSMYDHLEWRCTMRHSNTSLGVYTKQWHVEHPKQSGDEYDYSKIRYPWDPLSDQEMKYALYDVVGLCEAYRAEMDYWKDDLYTIPLTSTGYVRRISKKAWAHVNYLDRRDWMPCLECLRLLEEAFRGGDVHGSRYHSTPFDYPHAVVNHDVTGYDRASSYPDEIVNNPMPLGNWYKMSSKKGWISLEEIEKFIIKYERCVLTRVHFQGLELRVPNWEMPYIPKSKCGYYEDVVEDNGRVLAAKLLSMTITEVDWEIIKREYKWKQVYFSDAWYCRKRFLPEPFVEVVRSFFRDKTLLKGSEPGSLEDIEYHLKKQLLNALYGMAAQHVIKHSIVYLDQPIDGKKFMDQIDFEIYQENQNRLQEKRNEMTKIEKRQYREEKEKEIVDRHNKNAFLPFSVGVWVTAYARLDLHRAMWIVHQQGGRVLYADTDSVKYLGNVDFSALNDYYKRRSEQRGGYADDRKGNRHYMGVYEYEYTAQAFSHMGAKKYIYQVPPRPEAKSYTERTGFHLTIAGVSKEKGAQELHEKGGFAAFHSGIIFEKSGGTRGIYNDTAFGNLEVDGHSLYIGKNVCLLPDTYTLGLSDDYARILDEIAAAGHIEGDFMGVQE